MSANPLNAANDEIEAKSKNSLFNSEMLTKLLHVSSETNNSDLVPNEHDLSPFFWMPLLDYDVDVRIAVCKNMVKTFQCAVRDRRFDFLDNHVGTIVRYAKTCPFEEVRIEFEQLLEEITPSLISMGIPVPSVGNPSRYFSSDAFVPITTDDEEMQGQTKQKHMSANPLNAANDEIEAKSKNSLFNSEMLTKLLHVSSETNNSDLVPNEHDLSPFFWMPLLDYDVDVRIAVCKNMVKTFQCAVRDRRFDFLDNHVGTIVRYAKTCPFEEVRIEFEQLLEEITPSLISMGIPVPSVGNPSRYFSSDAFVPITTDDEEMQDMYQELFRVTGRISNLDFCLAQHPSYFKRFHTTLNYIMRAPGPVPYDWRNYIAIMSVSRYQCDYLYHIQSTEFLLNDGDPTWLEGIEFAPSKIQKLTKLNAYLAHQSFKLNSSLISELCNGENSWSVRELVLVIIIMATFRKLASLVYSLGINDEVDFRDTDISEILYQDLYESDSYEDGYESLVATLRSDISDEVSGVDEQAMKAFEDSELPAAESTSSQDYYVRFDSQGSILHLFGRYLPMMVYEDFRTSIDETYHIETFTWEEDCYGFIKRYYTHLANLLDDEFYHSRELSYNNVYNEKNVDTAPFRKSLWYYVHRVHGIFHDDFNYRLVNQCLSLALKALTKKAICYPHIIEPKDFDFGMKLHVTEKIHIMIIASEAKQQAELLLGLRTLLDSHT
eukprot:TRINITY_DN7022_c0_g1_i1.p1 TRINITY_DN7022_c0_g1~~TRINITY_DN7022_c0_g1_i1.p1  ORF type:complete len:731 (-),score=112.34 TRINITY_DN7022_c0_g1_i1:54-2204(-)